MCQVYHIGDVMAGVTPFHSDLDFRASFFLLVMISGIPVASSNFVMGAHFIPPVIALGVGVY